MKVTAFSKDAFPQVSINLQKKDAARTAFDLLGKYPYVSAVDKGVHIVLSSRCGITKQRLQHIIDTDTSITLK